MRGVKGNKEGEGGINLRVPVQSYNNTNGAVEDGFYVTTAR